MTLSPTRPAREPRSGTAGRGGGERSRETPSGGGRGRARRWSEQAHHPWRSATQSPPSGDSSVPRDVSSRATLLVPRRGLHHRAEPVETATQRTVKGLRIVEVQRLRRLAVEIAGRSAHVEGQRNLADAGLDERRPPRRAPALPPSSRSPPPPAPPP